MGVSSGVYRVLLLLHIFAVIAGFGVTLVAPLFAGEARKRGGREGLAIAEATYSVIDRALYAIYAVPVLGILLIFVSDDAWKFSQGWISISLLLYLVAIGISHGVHLPNIRRMNVLVAELAGGGAAAGGGPPPQAVELEARGKKAAMFGGILNLLLVAIIVMMIWKPGA